MSRVEFSPQEREAAMNFFNAMQPVLDAIKQDHPEAKFITNDLFQVVVYTSEEIDLKGDQMDNYTEEILKVHDKTGIMAHLIPDNISQYKSDKAEYRGKTS